VKDKFRSALWLLKSVDQRQKTILKVATSIINFQRDFLDRGIEHLRPLVLRDVANDIGMHESTVSRVVNNKMHAPPQGVYEMSSSSTAVSAARSARRVVGDDQAADPEDYRSRGSAAPLSDSKIMSILQKEGSCSRPDDRCARLKIPTSNQRKVLSLTRTELATV
jgi:RNA polymerase sigma-54 factor